MSSIKAKNFDLISLMLVISLIFIGLINIYSVSYSDANSIENFFSKQLIFVIFSFSICLILILLDINFYFKYASIIYIIILLSLILVLIFGKEINGAKSWFNFIGFSLQPSEIMKPVTALAIAKYLSNIHSDIKNLKIQFYSFIIILAPISLILLQPDPGTALIFLSFYLVLHIVGLPSLYLNIFVSISILFISTIVIGMNMMLIIIGCVFSIMFLYMIYKKIKKSKLIYLSFFSVISILISTLIFESIFEQRHRDRINVVLGIEKDLSGIGYNTNQSKLAFNSGGFFGQGFLKGTQTKGDFIPEQHSDYIFATIGEEWGFFGSLVVISLFMILLLRMSERTAKQTNLFYKIFSYSAIAIIFFHFTINISMVIGIFPTVGIPLPFISYGGSSLLSFMILFAGYLKIDSQKKSKW